MATGHPKNKWVGKILNQSEDAETDFSIIWENNTSNKLNRLYFGDNLDVLKLLSKDNSIKGKVKLIYIDPPYSTNSIFQTKDLKNGYTDLLKGDEYLNFMKTRLEYLHKILADDGSIYIHMDDNMAFEMKVLMDKIFGQNNFKNFIIRQKCRPKNFTKNSYGNIADYILFYTKTNKPIWHKPYDEWSLEKIMKEYQYIEEETGRRYKRVPIHAPGTRNGETGKIWKGMIPPAGKHWQYTPTKLDIFDKRGEIYWSKNGNPRRKVYLDESKGLAVQDIWLDYIDSTNQNTKITGYPTEKNINLLKRIILASSNENDLVLDCFVGSGTTLVAASELKRKWIGIDNESKAIETILRRFANGTSKLGDYVNKKYSEDEKTLQLKEKFISDFCLLSNSKKSADLESSLKKWNNWISIHKNQKSHSD